MVHVNGTGYKTVYKGTYQATDIQVDWLGGNIYWTESDSLSLKCVTLNGQYNKLVARTSYPPMFLLLDPPKRFVLTITICYAYTLHCSFSWVSIRKLVIYVIFYRFHI